MIASICRRVASDDELAQCLDIRRKVFVQEQHLFEHSDQDEYDRQAIHIAAFYQSRIIGTVRVYQDAVGIWWGGRLAVLKRYRGRAGRDLVIAAVALVKLQGAEHFYANILSENLNFFKNLGWRPVGDAFLLHGRQHMLVEADLA
ncbi:MAG: GNAT family N-acetyltransferase [Deltaproteobacteria bacterium]|nr:GNAT family N-acetyltransferase [Deltaproteobacteria bacterium]